MSLDVMIIFVSAVAILVISVLLVFHPDYEAGPIGVLGLLMLSIGAVARINDGIEDGYVSPRAVLIWTGIALFMMQLALRFIVRRHGNGGKWKKRK